MQLTGRFYNGSDYRYGFNGMEKDDELKGNGNSYDFGARFYDPRIGRMFKMDPRTKEYPWQTPYAYHRNSPIATIDYLGGGDPPTKYHTIKKGETLSSISKKYGVSVKDLAKINNITDVNKIQANTDISVLPEAHFKNNPYGGYNNPDDDFGADFNPKSLAVVGIDFVAGGSGDLGVRINNQIITNDEIINNLQAWSPVKRLLADGKAALKRGNPIFTQPYRAPSLIKYSCKAITDKVYDAIFNTLFDTDFKTDPFFNPIHVLGSFNFSLRLNGDGKTATAAIYDSKSISSFSDNKLDKSSNKSGDGILSTTYQRYIWTVKLE